MDGKIGAFTSWTLGKLWKFSTILAANTKTMTTKMAMTFQILRIFAQAARNLRDVYVQGQESMFEDDDEDLVMCDKIDRRSDVECENDKNEED
ncbi:unnamed protein product [Parnassius apollo]|uniref:(apollo) hypothetical protein n=1 Tax=Parnassius apollo TaxID=110799 RepID=A0A8S3XBK9_PARAO|nr:unnamed protein product [Parnassius apollo]